MNCLTKKFSLTILIASLLLFVFIFYKSEIFWNGNFRDYYKIYYLLSLILIFFSIISFFINDKIKQYLIISGISLIASLYLFNGYLTFKELKELQSREKIYKKQTGKKWDTRNKLDIYEELKKKNRKITISLNPSVIINKNYSTLPLSGQSNLETIFCNENGYYSIYQSDRYGFNNPDNEWDKKEIEYLLVGDSFTHGACVNRPNDISSVLRNISNKSVLNLGMSGNGPLIEFATLREYLDKNVKKVLWIYFEGNDLLDLKKEKKNDILIKYLKDLNFTQNLKFKQNDINNLLLNLIEEKAEKERERNTFEFELLKFIKIFKVRDLIFQGSQSTLEFNKILQLKFKEILQLAKELTDKNNSELYFIYLPKYDRYKINYDNTNYYLIKNIVTELKIPFVNIHNEVFEKEQNPLKLFSFEAGGHYNVNGYQKVAETIYKFTKD